MSIRKRKKEHTRIPRSVQDAIPISTVYDDGLFRVGKNQYSRTYKFEDINYQVASEADKETMFERYCALLNSLDSNAATKITINNRKLNQADFEKRIFIKEQDDNLNEYRREYNQMLLAKATAGNSIIQEKYITVTVTEKSADDARQYFNRFGASLAIQLNKLGSKCTALGAIERLRIFYDFYRTGEESDFTFDLKDSRRKGHSFKDYICPDSMEIQKDHIALGERYARVLFLKEYANFLKDDFVTELTTRCKNMMLSIDMLPLPTGKAVREVETRLLGTETNITNWQRKQNANNNFSAEVPYDLEMQRQELREFLDDLSSRDQKMMLSVLTIVITADTLEELNQQTKSMQEFARERVSQIAVLKFQQLDGLHTVLPAGMQKLDIFRTLITESLAIQIPFRVQEIAHAKGIFYGQNVISKNMILADRTQLLNGNSFILGVSGSGKSFAAKCEITSHMLATDADILIIDPEREYAPLVRALGGEVVEISATSPNHINAMDMTKEYGEINPIIEKSQFLQSLCEQIIAGHTFTKGQQSIIDRCTESVYRYYLQGNYQGVPPTLQDFREELLKQPEPEAHALALELELFTKGSLNTFAQQTNVDTDKRLICYDIMELGEQLRPIGMLVILDSILNRITANRRKGRQTFVYVDEIYLLFQYEYSAQFLFKLWKRVRKYGAFCTGITQDVEDLLQSHIARTMLSNSEFVLMLNQAATNREELARLLNISDTQLSYITNVDAGHGLIKIGNSLVPFENHFPRDTRLYQLMTTKPADRE